FTCAPENVDRMVEAVEAEVKAAQERGFSPEHVDKVKNAQRRALEVAVCNNGYWLTRLADAYRYGTDPRQILEDARLIDSVDAAAVKAAAAVYLDGRRSLLGIQRPVTA